MVATIPPPAHATVTYAATATVRTGEAIESSPGWPATDPRTTSVVLLRADSTPRSTEVLAEGA